ncbi:alpha/beta fold hydrolase [Mycobacterium sp. NPDC048908]|uniref:alpha/beta fold hydrolase n=1 Tax=Mycobacterium sp. NPDC048908 TaxID=3364292 RepID=UPI0037207C65
MVTFGLVHGAWHGAWCWERLTPELEALGHRVIAMNLPCDDSSATFDDYADVVCVAVTDVGEDLVLLGHSLAVQTIPLVAVRRPLRRLVYLGAIPGNPGQFLHQQLTDPDMLNPDYVAGLSAPDSHGRTTWVDHHLLRHLVFVVEFAASHSPFLSRPRDLANVLDRLR